MKDKIPESHRYKRKFHSEILHCDMYWMLMRRPEAGMGTRQSIP
jgi:hypothetical protein